MVRRTPQEVLSDLADFIETCPVCRGTGDHPWTESTRCSRCDGVGDIFAAGSSAYIEEMREVLCPPTEDGHADP